MEVEPTLWETGPEEFINLQDHVKVQASFDISSVQSSYLGSSLSGKFV